jgi:LPS-assembly protein
MFQLYSENRFAGVDRIGDADQLSFSITNRWLRRNTGEERFRASLGQIFYYQDREVTLPGNPTETSERSGILAEFAAGFGRHWNSSLNLEWNPDTEKTDQGLFRLRYNRRNRYLFNLGYRYRRNTGSRNEILEQADISFSQPLGAHWSVVGRWNYSVDDELDLDKYLGFEYESCCWAFRILSREFLLGQDLNNDAEYDTSIYFQFVFKGLSSSGSDIGRRLEENIIGYRDPFE